MQLRHNSQSLENEGNRICALLKDSKPLEIDDLKKVREIVDESEAIALGLLKLYGTVLISAVVLLTVLNEILHVDTTGFAILTIAPIFAMFTIHFLYEFRLDNYRKQIESRLKCKCCNRQVAGIKIHLVLINMYCPYCRATLPQLLGLEPTNTTGIDEPRDGPESPTGRFNNG